MAPVHLYLAAWVLGGVLLGLSMLLEARERELPEARKEDPALGPRAEPSLVSSTARVARLVPVGLIGFGLTGLLAKGLELDLWPWTPLTALSIGAVLIGLSYRLARPRAERV